MNVKINAKTISQLFLAVEEVCPPSTSNHITPTCIPYMFLTTSMYSPMSAISTCSTSKDTFPYMSP